MADKQGARMLLRQGLLPLVSPSHRPSALILPVGIRLHNHSPDDNKSRLPRIPRRHYNTRPSKYKRNNVRARPKSDAISMNNLSFLLPKTMVTPPLRKWLKTKQYRHPKYVWEVLKNWFQSWGSLVLLKFQSSPPEWQNVFKFRYEWRRKAIIPAAKQLHIKMSEALAKGDKDTLRSICTMEYYAKLASVIDRRPPGTRMTWKLVRYREKSGYPRLASDMSGTFPLPGSTRMRCIRQVVVSIASSQYITQQKPGETSPKHRGTSLVENIVLTSDINQDTWKQSEWKIWGTLPETDLKDYLADVELFEKANQIRKA